MNLKEYQIKRHKMLKVKGLKINTRNQNKTSVFILISDKST